MKHSDQRNRGNQPPYIGQEYLEQQHSQHSPQLRRRDPEYRPKEPTGRHRDRPEYLHADALQKSVDPRQREDDYEVRTVCLFDQESRKRD